MKKINTLTALLLPVFIAVLSSAAHCQGIENKSLKVTWEYLKEDSVFVATVINKDTFDVDIWVKMGDINLQGPRLKYNERFNVVIIPNDSLVIGSSTGLRQHGWSLNWLIVKPTLPCNKCLLHNCIYEQIERVYDESEMDLNETILSVCKERGITDLKTIDLIKANYDL